MRKALGFLGLVEDDYNEYAATEATRPFSEDTRDDPTWAPKAPAPTRPSAPAPRINPTPAPRTGPAPLRAQPGPSNLSARPAPVSLHDSAQPARSRPTIATTPSRGGVSYSAQSDIEIMAPLEFNECQRITDQVRLNRIVIMVVTQCGPAVARRLIDFAAGTAYALRASVETLEKGAVYAICPHGASLSPEVRARLVASNYQSAGY
jgi:FtsZ-interacting cell division protein YlmF